ncbi:ParE family toxin-like protein [Mycoplana ramosa]|uniref:ParE-like toxin domain-containing protein n=1 Tax=Mycoplana ramosa TaxID=40837 RepID=A0ABW3YYA0_MYCRA
MKHHASPSFWRAYNTLPARVQKLADQNFELLKAEPKHPSLHLKQVGRFWSVRVSLSWRALAVSDGDDLIWFWIGSHADYDRLVK